MSGTTDSILHSIRVQKTALFVRDKHPSELHIGSVKMTLLRAEMNDAIESCMREPVRPHTAMLRAALDEWPAKVMGLEIVEVAKQPHLLRVE